MANLTPFKPSLYPLPQFASFDSTTLLSSLRNLDACDCETETECDDDFFETKDGPTVVDHGNFNGPTTTTVLQGNNTATKVKLKPTTLRGEKDTVGTMVVEPTVRTVVNTNVSICDVKAVCLTQECGPTVKTLPVSCEDDDVTTTMKPERVGDVYGVGYAEGGVTVRPLRSFRSDASRTSNNSVTSLLSNLSSDSTRTFDVMHMHGQKQNMDRTPGCTCNCSCHNTAEHTDVTHPLNLRHGTLKCLTDKFDSFEANVTEVLLDTHTQSDTEDNDEFAFLDEILQQDAFSHYPHPFDTPPAWLQHPPQRPTNVIRESQNTNGSCDSPASPATVPMSVQSTSKDKRCVTQVQRKKTNVPDDILSGNKYKTPTKQVNINKRKRRQASSSSRKVSKARKCCLNSVDQDKDAEILCGELETESIDSRSPSCISPIQNNDKKMKDSVKPRNKRTRGIKSEIENVLVEEGSKEPCGKGNLAVTAKSFEELLAEAEEDGIERVKTKKGIRKRRRNEWTSEEVVMLLTCTKLLIDYELKTISQALFELIKRDPGKCWGRAAEKKLKRMNIFENWKTCNKPQVIVRIDEQLKKYEPLNKDLQAELVTITAKVKAEADRLLAEMELELNGGAALCNPVKIPLHKIKQETLVK